MSFLNSIFAFNAISTTTSLIALASVIGILLGNIRYKGVGLGIGGVLFGGIFMGWLSVKMGWIPTSVQATLDPASIGIEGYNWTEEVQLYTKKYAEFAAFKDVLKYVQEFGLILFVYTIGIQVGPGFFASLKGSGLKLIALAVCIVLIGATIALSYNIFFDLRLDHAVGIYAGAVTNTPALGAGQQMIGEIAQSFADAGNAVPNGFVKEAVSSAYAVAYPFGICGILITMFVIRFACRVNIEKEGELYEVQKKSNRKDLNTQNIIVKNKTVVGKTIADIIKSIDGEIACSRLKRNNELMVPSYSTEVQEGDILHFVASDDVLAKASASIGESVDVSLTTRGTALVVKKLVVTNEKILGKTFDAIGIKPNGEVTISRLVRTGLQFIPHSGTVLQFGDQLNVVGRKESIDEVASIVGDSAAALTKVHMLPVFIGLFLGMVLGSVAIPVPGLPAALKLGLAGGPLVVALLLSRYGHIITRNKIHWFMPAAGNSALREIGIVLFLSIVGFNSGANGFVEDLINGPGLTWMFYGVFVTIIPLLICGFIGYKLLKINYLSICGMLAGSMTDPPALAFANGLYHNSEASSLGYATVYPFTMFLRILTPQIMVIIALACM